LRTAIVHVSDGINGFSRAVTLDYPRPWRSNLPGVAPVHFPCSKVVSPFTMIAR
jgi:hypothetical protein